MTARRGEWLSGYVSQYGVEVVVSDDLNTFNELVSNVVKNAFQDIG